jgi:hypothetical protein
MFDIDGESIYETQNQDSKHYLDPKQDVIYEDGYNENEYYAENQRDYNGNQYYNDNSDQY